MLVPMLISSVFILAVTILCLVKPQAGRVFVGIFFLVMALGVNGSFTFSNPQAYVDYAEGALIPFYRNLALNVVTINPLLFGLLLMAFEITMGLLILHKQKSVKIGLVGTIFFLIGIAPLSLLQIPWLGLIVGEAYLFTKEFETTFWDGLKSKLFSLQQ
jgi:hypothetical protein